MSGEREFRLPDLGEGQTESEIVTWRVAVGDTVTLNQILADVETAKAVVELPSPHAGVISRLYVGEGTTVLVGDPIVAFTTEGSLPTSSIQESPVPARAIPASAAVPVSAVPASAVPASAVPVATGAVDGDADDAPPPNLVGYGAAAESHGAARRARRVPSTPGVAHAHAAPSSTDRGPLPRSTPPVRKLARDLGIALGDVTGTGADGLVTRDDVEAFRMGPTGTAPTRAQAAHTAPAEVVTGSGSGTIAGSGSGETVTPVRGIRKLTAEAMVASAFTAPHVTVFLEADVTRTTELFARLKATAEFRDVKLTFLAAVAKALCLAVTRIPEVNSRWDEGQGSIIRFAEVNLGIAVATPRGLLVPNIRNAGSLGLASIATSIGDLARIGKAGKTAAADMTGGTITISNIGVFGVDAGTPILNQGEAAILAVGAVRKKPWEFEGQIALRDVVTLSLSFDHRVLDGAEGSRFLRDIGQALSDPASVFAH